MTKICFLEDDPPFAQLYRELFQKLGYEVSGFESVTSFLAVGRQIRFDLLLVDWTLSDGNADTVITWVRENLGWQVPILIISANDDEENVVHALWLGADDYVFKPLRLDELVARVQAMVRRTSKMAFPRAISVPPYEMDIKECTITFRGEPVSLTQKEFDLTFFLFENAGKLVSRVQILNKVWGHAGEVETRTIDAHISKIKKKLSISPKNGWQIFSVYGYGYRLEKQDPAQDTATSAPTKTTD